MDAQRVRPEGVSHLLRCEAFAIADVKMAGIVEYGVDLAVALHHCFDGAPAGGFVKHVEIDDDNIAVRALSEVVNLGGSLRIATLGIADSGVDRVAPLQHGLNGQ